MKHDGIQCLRALRIVVILILSSLSSSEMGCDFERPNIQYSFIQKILAKRLFCAKSSLEIMCVSDFLVSVAPLQDSNLPRDSSTGLTVALPLASSTELACRDVQFIKFPSTGVRVGGSAVRRREGWRSHQGLGHGRF